MLANKKFFSQQGAIPLILIILILLLFSSGLGVALVKILEPKQQEMIKKGEQKYEEGVKNQRIGSMQLSVTLSSLAAGENILVVSYDEKSVKGKITLSNQGITVPLSIAAYISPVTGVISEGHATGYSQSTFPKGSVKTVVEGKFTGTVDATGKASGTLVLSQDITNIEGEVPQLTVGQRVNLPTITWQGTAAKIE